MMQPLLVSWIHILISLDVVIPPFLCIPSMSFLMLLCLHFIRYRSLLSIITFLWIPFMSFLALVDTPFLQCVYFPGLPLLFFNSTLYLLQSSRIIWTPSFTKWFIIATLQFRSRFHWLLYTYFLIPSSLSASYFKTFLSGLPMIFTLGISLYSKFPSIFTLMISFPVSSCFFCLGVILVLSLCWLLRHRYHWPIIGITTRIFISFGSNLHVISSINVLHHFVAISLHGLFYLCSWLAIMTLLALGS